jgi:hypothetical protein
VANTADSDDCIVSITGDQVAALQHLQDTLPTDLKCLALAPLLEVFQKAYEAAIPVKVRN